MVVRVPEALIKSHAHSRSQRDLAICDVREVIRGLERSSVILVS